VLLAVLLSAPVRAEDEQAAATPSEAEQPAPAAPTVAEELRGHLPGRGGDPRGGHMPGLTRPDHICRSRPGGASLFDARSGAVYYPGTGLVQMTIVDGVTGKPVVVYYAAPSAAAVQDPAYYQALLAQLPQFCGK
jgi:hypothetical protein